MKQPIPNPSCPNCVALAAELSRVNGRLIELEATVKKLLAKSKTSSRNSSRPPSSDPPWSKEGHKRSAEGKRRRGGQPGHEKAERELKPPEEVDCVEDIVPDLCVCCGERLDGSGDELRRHQVTELPPMRPHVTEYRLHGLTCGECGAITYGSLPDGVPKGAFGPRLRATIALLTGNYRVSRRAAQGLTADLFGLQISLGAISKIEGRVAEALAAPHAEALARVQDAEFKHADETSWKQSNANFWLWVAKSCEATAFLIRDNRSGKVARELLGEDLTGTLITDRYSGYTWVDLKQRQVCWAHLFRDFRKIAESGEKSERIGEQLEMYGGAVFTYWHQYRNKEISRERWYREADRFRGYIRAVLEEGAKLDQWRAPAICRGILKVESALWTFVRTEGLEPTNNDAERAIRGAVIWRKTSLGTQSDRGSRYVERMLTCAATLRTSGRNVLDYLHQVCAAQLCGGESISLFS